MTETETEKRDDGNGEGRCLHSNGIITHSITCLASGRTTSHPAHQKTINTEGWV